MNEEVRHFSLRKLSIGLASVLVGVSIFGASQTVKADTVADQNTSAVTNNTQSSDTQENKNVVESSFSNDNQADNAKSNATQTQEATDSNELQEKSAEKDIVSTSSLQESNNQSNTVTKKTVQHGTLENGQKAQSFNLPKNSQKLNKKVLATNLIETPSSPTTNGGFDEATWGKLDVNNWQGSVQDGVYELTGYTGDKIHIIVPNEADFEKAGKSTNGLQVGITCDTVRSLPSNQTQTIAFSKTNNQKVKAVGTDWSFAFSFSNLSKFDGSSLDVSNVTDMSGMFSEDNKVSDLTSLANWNTSNVTDMSNMFHDISINDLTPLANWDTSKVTDMSSMFSGSKVSNLTPLAHWDTSKVTNMYNMFYLSKVSDLTPLANWNTSNVTNMCQMFEDNQISDLTPLSHWDTGKVTNMRNMFDSNQISNLTPLAHWDTSNVTNMCQMFSANQISDLTSLANWDTSNVTDMSYMFFSNSISDLTSLAHWDTSKVTNMNSMFFSNSISDLTPLAHWNTSKVTNMSYMFGYNSYITDLKPIANWNISGIALFSMDHALNLTNVNTTPLMQVFLKQPNILQGAGFITNNAGLVKTTAGQDLPDSTNTAKRTIVFKIPNATPRTIVQTINYKAIAPVRVDFDSHEIVETYPVKESDWQLDTSKQNDDVIIDGVICFKPVKIPHVNGYKAYIVPNKSNPALFTVSFIAVPTENKPSTPVEETPSKPSASTAPTDHTSNPVETTPSKPSASTDHPNNSAWTDLDHKVVNALNQSDSGWTMPENNSIYKAEVSVNDATIDLSDLVIAQPVHAQTRTQIHVTKHFKLRKHGKKHAVKHFKQRKKAARTFKKYRL